MRILIATLAMAMLAACVSRRDLEPQYKSITGSTPKDPKKYAV